MFNPICNISSRGYQAFSDSTQAPAKKAKTDQAQSSQPDIQTAKDTTFPPSQNRSFKGHINDSEIYHWDSWVGRGSNPEINKTLYLLSMKRDNQNKLENNHVRSFHVIPDSEHGYIFEEKGPVLTPSSGRSNGDNDTHYNSSIWTGSTLATEIDGKEQILFSYTGIPDKGADRPIYQTFGLAIQNQESGQFEPISTEALLDPIRDRESLEKNGYHLGKPGMEGSTSELEKHTLCLRDPFLVEHTTDNGDKQLQVFFAAKKASPDGDGGLPAVGRAILKDPMGDCSLEVLPPVSIKGMDPAISQYEVPQVVKLAEDKGFLMATSTCERETSNDTDAEVNHGAFILHGQNLEGPYEVVAQALTPSDAKYPIGLYGEPKMDNDGNINIKYFAAYDATSPLDRTMGPPMELNFRLPTKEQ